MEKILVTGGTGFIGKALVTRLRAEGYDPVVFSRKGILMSDGLVRPTENGLIPSDLLADLYGIVNLAGENIGKRWTSSIKSAILSSRIDTTNLIISSIRQNRRLGLPIPAVLVSASAVGYYGISPSGIQTEQSPAGEDFLADVCRQWEQIAMSAATDGVRVTIFRFGVVLGPDGGILERMAAPFKWRVGGVIGSGRQHISWIHRNDLIQALLIPFTNLEMQGAYNLTSPNPVTMSQFMDCLGSILGSPSWTIVPGFIAKLLFGEMAESLLLADQQVFPRRLLEQGFVFSFPELSTALAEIYQFKTHK